MATPLTSERNVNMEKARSLYKYFCGCNSEDFGSVQLISRWLASLVSQGRGWAWKTLAPCEGPRKFCVSLWHLAAYLTGNLWPGILLVECQARSYCHWPDFEVGWAFQGSLIITCGLLREPCVNGWEETSSLGDEQARLQRASANDRTNHW